MPFLNDNNIPTTLNNASVVKFRYSESLATILQTEHGEVFRSNGKVAGIDSDGLSFDLTVGDETEETIEKLVSIGYIDDARYAEVFIRSKLQQGKGLPGILRDLRSQGIEF